MNPPAIPSPKRSGNKSRQLFFVFLLAALPAFTALVATAEIPDTDLNLDPGLPLSAGKKKGSAPVHLGMGSLDDKRKLAPGDRLSFRIAEEGDEPQIVTVASSGEIDFPYVGRVQSSGRTCKAVADDIRRSLEKSFYSKATVGLALDTASTLPMGRFFVTGQVMKQGAQEIARDREVTVAEAILEAGGFADFADRRRVRLIRPLPDGGSKRFTVDVKAILERGEARKDMIVQPGDYIVVPERMFNF